MSIFGWSEWEEQKGLALGCSMLSAEFIWEGQRGLAGKIW